MTKQIPYRELLYLEYNLDRIKKEFATLNKSFSALQLIISIVENRVEYIRTTLGKVPFGTKPFTSEEYVAYAEAITRTSIVNASKRRSKKTKS